MPHQTTAQPGHLTAASSRSLARMSHRGGGWRRKVARADDGGRSRSGNPRADLHRRSCWSSSPRGVRIFGQRKTHHSSRLVVQRNWSRYFLPLSSAELQLATAGAPGEIVPDKDSRSTATPRFASRYAKSGCRCRPAILIWNYFARCTGSCKLQFCAAEREEVARPVALHNESGGMVCLSLTKNPNPRGEDDQQDRR